MLPSTPGVLHPVSAFGRHIQNILLAADFHEKYSLQETV